MVDGLTFNASFKKTEFLPLTAAELQAATDRRQKQLAALRDEQERQEQRKSDLEALKTAEIGVLREIIGRLL